MSMKRRQFCVALPLTAVAWSLTGCSHHASSGPGEIKWDRDTCTRCSMVISDKRFAGQIRDPNGKVWKFDDIGCAMFWLMQQTFSEQTPSSEYWFVDYKYGGWVDARKVWYLEGKKSPMAYNFAAVGEPEAGTISYPEMKKRILARGK